MPITAANGTTYSDDQIKQFFANNPTNDAIASQAAQLGLNADQVSQAARIAGKNWTTNDVTSWANSNGYNFNGVNGGAQKAVAQPSYNPMTDPNRAGQGYGTNGRDIWSSTQKRWITPTEVGQYLAKNPTQQDILKNAASLGLTQTDLLTALRGQGLSDADINQRYNTMANNLFNGGLGYSSVGGWRGDTLDLSGRIVAGGGHSQPGGDSTPWVDGTPSQTTFDFNPNTGLQTGGNGGNWLQTGTNVGVPINYSAGDGAVQTGGTGIINSVTGGSGSGVTTSSSVTNGVNGTNGTNGVNGVNGGTTYLSGSTQPGNWVVDQNQLVQGQLQKVIDPNSPLMQQARTRALERMNDRGIINSTLAQTAADQAMYDTAMNIAKQDAGTYADAAKTNAGAQTSWAIAQNNNATSMANTNSSLAAQRELAHASQLYNNLANQTATASSIQTWGLNTISSIMNSDLSADAKNAAINQIKTFMADSYQIQGDWHTSAAKAIDAIFGG